MARSVLIVKLAAIGDVVMALPMVTALKEADPHTRITWMCGHTVAPLLAHVEGIDEVVAVDESAMLRGSWPSKAAAVASAWWRMMGRRFDAVYVGHSDARYRILNWPVRASTHRSLGGDQHHRPIVHGRPHSDEYVRLVTDRDDHRARSCAFPPVHLVLPNSLARRLQAYNPEGKPLVAITPGGARNVARENPLRRWPLERYATLADALCARGFGVVLTGSGTDGWVRELFHDRPVLDLIGATGLPALAAVLARCTVVASHDSGPLHIARMVGTPLVALLGPTPPTMFFRPEPSMRTLWPGRALACSPCYDGYEFAGCDDNVCMQLISVDSVLDEVEALASVSAQMPAPDDLGIAGGTISRPQHV